MTERCESSIEESVPLSRPVRIRSPDAYDQIAELGAALAARDRVVAFTRGELRHAIAPLRVLADEMAALAEDAHTLPAIAARAAVLARDIRRLLATAHWVAEIVVRDHGPGLDPASLHRLFDPTVPERQRTAGGMGVGPVDRQDPDLRDARIRDGDELPRWRRAVLCRAPALWLNAACLTAGPCPGSTPGSQVSIRS